MKRINPWKRAEEKRKAWSRNAVRKKAQIGMEAGKVSLGSK